MTKSADVSDKIWQPSEKLSTRIKSLRDEYFSFNERYDYYTNEVRPYTTGTSWDNVYGYINWGIAPEGLAFFPGYKDNLRALAEKVEFPDEYYKLSIAERRAHFFNKVLEKNLPTMILKDDLIIGSHFNTALSKNLTKSETKKWSKNQDKYFKELNFRCETGEFNFGAAPGHLIPHYEKAIKIGFSGIQKELKELRKSPKNKKHSQWLDALIESCEGPRLLAARYSEEAEKLAKLEKDPSRKSELLHLSQICKKVPWEPAESFWEAVQSLWFTHILVMAAESYPGPGTSPGRIDQYLYPYYKQDIESGKIDSKFAKEILSCYWIKHNYAYDFQGQVGNSQGINSSFGQLITLGGIDKNHEDASNELTLLMLDIIDEINLLEPKPNVRIHAKTSDKVMKKVAEMIAKTQGSPFLMNFDEPAMKGMIWQGIPEDEVWNYAPVGCLENTMIGNDVSGTVDVNVNIAKAVELTLFNGKDTITNKQVGPKTGNPKNFISFDQFKEAYLKQLTALLDRAIKANNHADMVRAVYEPVPYLSLLIDGCAESGKDCRAGGAKYNYITVEALGLANVADSLAAVKKLVYEENRISMNHLLDVLSKNFEGHEETRQLLLNHAPKYGNDDDYVDSIAKEISQYWGIYVSTKISPSTKRKYRGGYLSWNYFISFAPKTGALPDGRPGGEYLSGGVGPTQGVDTSGPTASILSVGKLGIEFQPNGSSHTMSFSPASLRDEEHIGKLISLLRTYGQVGGTSLQTNVVSVDTLQKAQSDPEKYRNLLVRVTGYNAYFTTLGKEQQDEIIARETHKV
jgi:formate C-acetyltransferase